jgi:uncharacterized iron-regulated membrane protein
MRTRPAIHARACKGAVNANLTQGPRVNGGTGGSPRINRALRSTSGQVQTSAFIALHVAAYFGAMKQLLVLLLVWVGPAILILLIGSWAILRGRMRRARRMASQEPQSTETKSDRKAA